MGVPNTDQEWKMALMDFDCLIPMHMHEGLRAYVEERRPVGGFLAAVFSNDLYDAVCRADVQNQKAIANYVIWLREYAPSECHGSPEAYDSWVAQVSMEEAG